VVSGEWGRGFSLQRSRSRDFWTQPSIKAFTSSSLLISARLYVASPPKTLILASTCLPKFSRRLHKKTFAPSCAKAYAVPSPMPEIAPVISTTLFANLPFGFAEPVAGAGGVWYLPECQ
jgi:hypothetical protein